MGNLMNSYILRASRGTTYKEKELNKSRRAFDAYLKKSPNAEDLFIDGIEMKGAVLSHKQNLGVMDKKILTHAESLIEPGSHVSWENRTWLVLEQSLNEYKAHKVSLARHENVSFKLNNQQMKGCLFGVINAMNEIDVKVANAVLTHSTEKTTYLLVSKKYNYKFKPYDRLIFEDRVWEVEFVTYEALDGVYAMSIKQVSTDSRKDEEVKKEPETAKITIEGPTEMMPNESSFFICKDIKLTNGAEFVKVISASADRIEIKAIKKGETFVLEAGTEKKIVKILGRKT